MRHTNSTISSAGIASPKLISFSPDSNIIGDGITDADLLTLSGTAVANSSVSIFDGTALLGMDNGECKWCLDLCDRHVSGWHPRLHCN